MCGKQHSPLFILRKSRMRKRARTDLRGGRSVMVVPTATTGPQINRTAVNHWRPTRFSADQGLRKPVLFGLRGLQKREPYLQLDVM